MTAPSTSEEQQQKSENENPLVQPGKRLTPSYQYSPKPVAAELKYIMN